MLGLDRFDLTMVIYIIKFAGLLKVEIWFECRLGTSSHRSIIGSINLGTNLVLFFFRAVISYGILSFGSISIKLMVDFS